MSLSVVILAAGQGTRMRSDLPKVMHPLAGRPLVEHVYLTAKDLHASDIHIVYGHSGEQVLQSLAHLDATWVEQAEQLGTGHAVAQAMPAVADDQLVLILYGDVPLTGCDTLRRLVDAAENSGFALLTVELNDPAGYGRIVRGDGSAVLRIVEQKDAGAEEIAIKEVNTGVMAISAGNLKRWLARLGNDNAQGEYYLTDVVAMAVAEGIMVQPLQPNDEHEVLGVNNRAQLADLERYYQRQQAERLMLAGVSLMDPARFDLRGDLEVGRDVSIDVNVVLEGSIVLGDRVDIGPNVYLKNTRVGDDVKILANCVVEDAEIGRASRIGPFSRIRPDTRLSAEVHVGNFVEIKKTNVAKGTKINHLSYIGDSEIGARVNIGAGTITCNYDGANKYKTIIGDDVFIGSDTQLIAPVEVGAGATIGAGTTVAKDAPPGALTVGRARQQVIENWERPQKKK
jgi:bifunctional UDP-N-acetylglucosamine pyrophosphorylase/glucosamine-1-phosphate N-acetyltransferase